ncbi:MAG TPA: SRPBCC domain-containing protein [Stellaceae bacterium]|nr:SRPBCC domain-containing protein [Stellaceae bacterium]
MADIKHQIAIAAAPEKVYAALATAKGLSGWWTADSSADEAVGGKAEFGFDKRQAVYRMKIEKLAPGREVAWSCHGGPPEWIGTTLTWTLARDGDGTVLRFTHGGWKSVTDFCAMCNSTWGELMYRLKAFVEGSNPGPHWRE